MSITIIAANFVIFATVGTSFKQAEERFLAKELGLSGMQGVALASSSARSAVSVGREIERQILEAM